MFGIRAMQVVCTTVLTAGLQRRRAAGRSTRGALGAAPPLLSRRRRWWQPRKTDLRPRISRGADAVCYLPSEKTHGMSRRYLLCRSKGLKK